MQWALVQRGGYIPRNKKSRYMGHTLSGQCMLLQADVNRVIAVIYW